MTLREPRDGGGERTETMATGWSISIGYNSDRAPIENAELFAILREVATTLRNKPHLLAVEALGYGAPEKLDGENIEDFCEVYRRDWLKGGPLRIIEPLPPDDPGCIHIMASGGAPARIMKEHVARAFCRLVVQSMHRRGIEVNLHVA